MTASSDNRHKLTVLEGGKSLPVSKMHRILLEAYVTDTRLMGVLAVGAHWNIIAPTADRNDPDNWEELYQYIYIDCEEAGFETYHQVRQADPDLAADAAEHIEDPMICGLGAKKVDLSERQLRLLLQSWYQFNLEHDLPMPAGAPDYRFLLDPPVEADVEERQALMKLICPPLHSDLQVINYFLMRCFGRDYEGARYLAGADQSLHPDFPLDIYDRYVCTTFCRNEIENYRELPDGSMEYLCDSLVETNGEYESVISLVCVKNLRVVGFSNRGHLPITQAEAAMILKKTEYVTLYEVMLSEEDLEENIDEFTLGFHTTMSEYENGRLFMSFRTTNDHVDSRHFRLSNDVRGMYFLTECGQLLLCAYSPADIRYLEGTIHRSVLAPYLIPSGRYNLVPGEAPPLKGVLKFQDPVIYEFMNSTFDRFEDFLAALQGR